MRRLSSGQYIDCVIDGSVNHSNISVMILVMCPSVQAIIFRDCIFDDIKRDSLVPDAQQSSPIPP
jgi:hypothetical protein